MIEPKPGIFEIAPTPSLSTINGHRQNFSKLWQKASPKTHPTYKIMAVNNIMQSFWCPRTNNLHQLSEYSTNPAFPCHRIGSEMWIALTYSTQNMLSLEVKAHLHMSTYCICNQQRMQVTTHNLIKRLGKADIQLSVTIHTSGLGRFIMELYKEFLVTVKSFI